jgi:hypothetical protein
MVRARRLGYGSASMRSVPDVCEVTALRGPRAGAEFDLLLEVSHGATRAEHFDRLRAELRGPFPDDLRAFYFVNTDVGAPEVAHGVARRFVAADARRAALVIRCLVPRTFVDCNRLIDPEERGRSSAPGELTPGLHAWVREEADRRLLLARHAAYQACVEEACEAVCARGGRAVMVHSYAPRSIDVPVDERVVEHLRAAYAPERLPHWPLRASVDLIAESPEGECLADDGLVARVEEAYRLAGFDVVRNGAYALHPATLAARLARRHLGRTLCLELRRDLLVPEFTPFRELNPDPVKVERAAAPLASALDA